MSSNICCAAITKTFSMIWQELSDKRKHFFYEEIIESERIFSTELNNILTNYNNQETIAILSEHSPIIVPVIIGILKYKVAVCFINPSDSIEEIQLALDDFGANILIAKVDVNLSSSKFVILKTISILEETIKFVQYSTNSGHRFVKPCDIGESERIIFCARTSGSTGKPKVIRVPYKCFQPNITSLTKLLSITSDDVFYISSPPTFDPFFVDFFLALQNGSTIIMTTNILRLQTHLLPNILLNSTKSSITIAQMTPSLFQKWTVNEINKIMSPEDSSLRCLILGGETFPSISKITKWQNWLLSNRKRLFNIYGLTEISCWCSIYEVTEKDIENESMEIPIGEPLDDDVKLYVKNIESNDVIERGQGLLFIESQNRQCIIENVWPDFYKRVQFPTEDLVNITDNGKFVFIGRSNDIIKRYGKRISLKNIEKRALTCCGVNDACCIYDIESYSLILFICFDEKQQEKPKIQQFFTTNGPNYEIPDKIIMLKRFPLSQHGKISKIHLLSQHKEMISGLFKQTIPRPDEIFILKLNHFLGLNGKAQELSDSDLIDAPRKKPRMELDLSFTELGGTSFLAINISSQIDYIFGVHFRKLLPKLLDRNIPIKAILQYLKEFNLNENSMSKDEEDVILLLQPKWTLDFKKCVDASPTICSINHQKILSIGSHSGILINASLGDGSVQSKIQLPDRIESSIAQYDQFGIVGCYDGFLYCYELLTGEIQWKFQSGGMIKSKPLIVGDKVIFGNYNLNQNVWCLDVKDGHLMWSCKFGIKSIYSALCHVDGNQIFACSLDGTFGVILLTTGTSAWTKQTSSPIFSNPCSLPNLKRILIAEVIGVVHCITFNGETIWTYKANGNIYSSFEFIKLPNENYLIFFGCYDSFAYCLNISGNGLLLNLHWQFEMCGKIFATPKLYHLNQSKPSVSLIICCTNGTICIVNALNGRFLRKFRIDGDVFSSPVVDGSFMIVGCRDNFVYNFNLDE